MNSTFVDQWLRSLPREQLLLFLAHLSHNVSIAGRETYNVAGGVEFPQALRQVNEVQHRLSAVLAAALRDQHYQIPSLHITTMFICERSDDRVQQLLQAYFKLSMDEFRGS